MGRAHLLALVALCGIAAGSAGCSSSASATAGPVGLAAEDEPPAFEHVIVRVQRNGKGDVELHVDVAASVGMRRLVVLDPAGRLVIEHVVPDGGPSGTGMDEIRVQAPDGAAYPEGEYTIDALTAGGTRLTASALLLLDLLPAPDVLESAGEAVHPDRVRIQWAEVPDAEGYVVEIEKEEGKILSVTLPRTSSGLSIPEGVLAPSTLYEVNVIAISPSGNRSESELPLLTGPR